MNVRIALMIAGAQKGGSTSLFRYLAEHPSVAVHGQREMSFFVNDDEYEQGESSRAWQRYVEDVDPARRFVAKHVKLMRSTTGIERLHAHDPGVHVALVLRDPVERAYSAFWYARSRGREPLASFDEALERESARLADLPPWHDVAYVGNGLYAEAVERLRARFGPERVHVFLNEDLRDDPHAVCRRLFEAIGVDPSFEPAVERRHNPAVTPRSATLARANRWLFESRSAPKRFLRSLVPDRVAYKLRHVAWRLNDRAFRPPPMSDAARSRLEDAFRPHDERLRELLGRPLPGWP